MQRKQEKQREYHCNDVSQEKNKEEENNPISMRNARHTLVRFDKKLCLYMLKRNEKGK
jgi:hypothetical protein